MNSSYNNEKQLINNNPNSPKENKDKINDSDNSNDSSKINVILESNSEIKNNNSVINK